MVFAIDQKFSIVRENTSITNNSSIDSSGVSNVEIKAPSFIRDGGTRSQYLMADGSVTVGGGATNTGATGYTGYSG